MTVMQRERPRLAARVVQGILESLEWRTPAGRRYPLASPGQIAVLFRWASWALAIGLIVSGSTATYGPHWERRGDVYLLAGLTFAVNLLLTIGLRPYTRLMRRFPILLGLDVVFCLWVYYRSDIWSSPFQFYSYSSLMLPVTIYFFSGAMGSSLFFLFGNIELLYRDGKSFVWAQGGGIADTYLMQLAIVPLLAFVFAYPNRLYARLRETQQRLDVAAREQLLVAERTRIAQSLHDSVAQMLFGIGMLSESALARLTEQTGARESPAPAPQSQASLADTLRQVRDLAVRGNREMRRAIYALNEPGPSHSGLTVSLDAMLADLAARTGLDTHLSAPGLPSDARSDAAPAEAPTLDAGAAAPEAGTEVVTLAEAAPPLAEDLALPDPVAQALYKVAREALANVEKHAGAMNVWVGLQARPETAGHARLRRVTLTVRDDGRGFRRPLLALPGEPDEDEVGQLHFGLGNMRAAVEAVGGRLEVTTSVGRGTTVIADVPVP